VSVQAFGRCNSVEATDASVDDARSIRQPSKRWWRGVGGLWLCVSLGQGGVGFYQRAVTRQGGRGGCSFVPHVERTGYGGRDEGGERDDGHTAQGRQTAAKTVGGTGCRLRCGRRRARVHTNSQRFFLRG